MELAKGVKRSAERKGRTGRKGLKAKALTKGPIELVIKGQRVNREADDGPAITELDLGCWW